MKDILLITNYWHFEIEKASSRYRSAADMISKRDDLSLEIVTSTFYHQTKKQRNFSKEFLNSFPYKITLCYEPGYLKNISLKRIASHKAFAANVIEYLKSRKRPDAILCVVPSLDVADAVTKFAKESKIPLLIDIQDLWPEAFKMALDIPLVSDILFYPMKKKAQRIYSRADTILAVSDTYTTVGKKSNPNAAQKSIYIGTDGELVKEKIKDVQIIKPENEFWIGYVGALGHSYDLKTVISALKILKDKGYSNIVFKVMGDGVLRNEFEAFAKSLNVNCEFLGFIEYGEMMRTLMNCDVAVNPIIGKSVSSIINKVADYSAAGVPVINTQNSDEYRNLLKNHNAGINVKNANAQDFANAVEVLYNDANLIAEMRKGQKVMYDLRFDRNKTYPAFIDEIERLIKADGN